MTRERSALQIRTKAYALSIIRLYKMLPETTEAQVLGKQLLRSGTSTGANTRAAFRGRSTKEFIAKMGIAIEECDESIFWLELLMESKTFEHKLINELVEESESLVSIFVSIVKKTTNNNV